MEDTPTLSDVAKLKFARKLASIDKTSRDRGVKTVAKWLSKRTEFTEQDSLSLWKGFHVCMWLSDKPLVQQDLAIQLSRLLHSLKGDKGFLFITGFYRTLSREWHSIDKLRLDKYFAFNRKFLDECFHFLANRNWEIKDVERFNQIIKEDFLFLRNEVAVSHMGIKMHLADIFLEELHQVTNGKLSSNILTLLLQPFFVVLVKSDELPLKKKVKTSIFGRLLSSLSEDDFSPENEEDALIHPKLSFNIDFTSIASKLLEFASIKETNSTNRDILHNLRKQFLQAARDKIERQEDPSPVQQETNDEPVVIQPPKKKKKKNVASTPNVPQEQVKEPTAAIASNTTAITTATDIKPNISGIKLKKRKSKVHIPIQETEVKPEIKENNKKDEGKITKKKDEENVIKKEKKLKPNKKQAEEEVMKEKVQEATPEFKLGEILPEKISQNGSTKVQSGANGKASKKEKKVEEKPPSFSLSPASQTETPPKSLTEFGFGKTPEEPEIRKGKSKNVKFGQNKVKEFRKTAKVSPEYTDSPAILNKDKTPSSILKRTSSDSTTPILKEQKSSKNGEETTATPQGKSSKRKSAADYF